MSFLSHLLPGLYEHNKLNEFRRNPHNFINPKTDLGSSLLIHPPDTHQVPIQFTPIGNPVQKIPGHPDMPVQVVPITPSQQGELDRTGRIQIPDVSGQTNDNGNMTKCPFLNFSWKVHKNPGHIIYELWDLTKRLVKWVVWNYQDFYELLTHPVRSAGHGWQAVWDAPAQLMWLTHLLWRGLIVTGLTFALVEIGPLLSVLTEWMKIFWNLLTETFGLVGRLLNDAFYLFNLIVEDLKILIHKFRGV